MLISTEYYDSLLKLGKKEEALKRSIGDFVGTLFYNVFKEMWESIPRSNLIPETSAERWFREMLLFEYSKKLARRDLKPLVDLIYKNLSKKVYGNGEGARSAEEGEGKDVRPDRRPEGDEHDNHPLGEGSEIGETGGDGGRGVVSENRGVYGRRGTWRLESDWVRLRELAIGVLEYGSDR